MNIWRKKDILVLSALLAAIFLSSACTFSKPDTTREMPTEKETVDYETDTRSTVFKNRDEKLLFLSRYLDMPSTVIDAEYHIVYKDNSDGRVPGPSDWDIRAALKVADKDMPLWTEGMKKILPQQINLGWWEDLKTPALAWETQDEAEYYIDPESTGYVVVYPALHIVLKMVSTTAGISMPLEVPQAIEEISGYDEYKILVADELGYDASTLPLIKTVLAKNLYTAEGEEVTVICYKAMYYDSPLYGISALVVSRKGNAFCEVLNDGSYNEECHLADIDGDGAEEILMQLCVGITGGAGTYQTDIYQLSDGGLDKIFSNPEWESSTYFDTSFSLHLSGGDTYTVENMYTGFKTSFTRRNTQGNPYFDQDGSLTDAGREHNAAGWLDVDPSFFLFLPVDVDDDGVFEIMAAQYTSLLGHADGLGNAYTILKWGANGIFVLEAGFLPYEEDVKDWQKNEKRFQEYEDNWYRMNDQKPEDELDDETIARTAGQRIKDMDFNVKRYPIDEAFYGSTVDKAYKDAYYKAVTNQKPVLRRKFKSLEYEEVFYKEVLRDDSLDDKAFLERSLKQSSEFYYMDYDGDGFPELINHNMGLFGLEYNPEEDAVYLFMDICSSYAYLMGAGQIYWHNPCISNKDMYSYEVEDRNGNREYAGFTIIADWKVDDWQESYYVSVDDFRNAEVSRDTWNELIDRLWTAYDNAPVPVSFDELFDK